MSGALSPYDVQLAARATLLLWMRDHIDIVSHGLMESGQIVREEGVVKSIARAEAAMNS